MKAYLLSLAAGVLVGVVYSLLNVRSPAPPVIALVGLAGILVGEQALPVVLQLATGNRITVEWLQAVCVPHVLGTLPEGKKNIPGQTEGG